MQFFLKEFLGNSLFLWLLVSAFVVFFASFLFILRKVCLRYSRWVARKKQKVSIKLIAGCIERLSSIVLLIVAIYMGTLILDLPILACVGIHKFMILVITIQFGVLANYLIGAYVLVYFEEKKGLNHGSLHIIGLITKVSLWVLLSLFLIDNLGFDIAALVAGLGVTGIAAALAVQNILGDMFASLSIVMDKPFEIGDFVMIDNMRGYIKHIGMKTTRILSLDGEEIVFSNNDLLKSRIRNFKRMEKRRIQFTLSVVYETPYEKLAKIPTIMEKIIQEVENAAFDRTHFKEYAASSLDFEVVFFVLGPAYSLYMDVQQEINLRIFEVFKREEIEFAYPTSTVFLANIESET